MKKEKVKHSTRTAVALQRVPTRIITGRARRSLDALEEVLRSGDEKQLEHVKRFLDLMTELVSSRRRLKKIDGAK